MGKLYNVLLGDNVMVAINILYEKMFGNIIDVSSVPVNAYILHAQLCV